MTSTRHFNAEIWHNAAFFMPLCYLLIFWRIYSVRANTTKTTKDD